MPEKKVLVITYYFPPMGMGGVQRVAKFVKYLPRFGWHPVVLTVKDVEYFSHDPSLLEDIPKGVKITRSGSLDPLRVLFLSKKLFKAKKRGDQKTTKVYAAKRPNFLSWFLFPDNKIGWLPWALAKGFLLCKREKIDLIFSTSPPVTAHLLGCLLKLFTGVRWVSDYRDLWGGGYQDEYLPTPFHWWLKTRLQRTFLRKADGVVCVNELLCQKLKETEIRSRESVTIQSGFDSEDFRSSRKAEAGFFKIVYMGTFSPDHNPEPFFAALSHLLRENVIPKNKVEFFHVGLCAGINLESLSTKYDLGDVVKTKGYLPHKEAVKFIGDAHLFLLAITPQKKGEVIITGKIFEYLAARRPILAVVPPKGAAARIINQFKAGKVASPEDISEIKETLFYFYQKFEKKEIVSEVKADDLKLFEREHLTLRLAKLFDAVLKKYRS